MHRKNSPTFGLLNDPAKLSSLQSFVTSINVFQIQPSPTLQSSILNPLILKSSYKKYSLDL